MDDCNNLFFVLYVLGNPVVYLCEVFFVRQIRSTSNYYVFGSALHLAFKMEEKLSIERINSPSVANSKIVDPDVGDVTAACTCDLSNYTDQSLEDLNFKGEDEENEPFYPSNFPLRKGNFYDVSEENDRSLELEHSPFDEMTDSENVEDMNNDHLFSKNEKFLDDFFQKQAAKFRKFRADGI